MTSILSQISADVTTFGHAMRRNAEAQRTRMMLLAACACAMGLVALAASLLATIVSAGS